MLILCCFFCCWFGFGCDFDGFEEGFFGEDFEYSSWRRLWDFEGKAVNFWVFVVGYDTSQKHHCLEMFPFKIFETKSKVPEGLKMLKRRAKIIWNGKNRE